MFGQKGSETSFKAEEQNTSKPLFIQGQDPSSDQNGLFDEENGNPYSRGHKKRFNKGLKMLSVIVKDIVVEKKVTTYKEVADIILKDSIKYDNLNLSSK